MVYLLTQVQHLHILIMINLKNYKDNFKIHVPIILQNVRSPEIVNKKID